METTIMESHMDENLESAVEAGFIAGLHKHNWQYYFNSPGIQGLGFVNFSALKVSFGQWWLHTRATLWDSGWRMQKLVFSQFLFPRESWCD